MIRLVGALDGGWWTSHGYICIDFKIMHTNKPEEDTTGSGSGSGTDQPRPGLARPSFDFPSFVLTFCLDFQLNLFTQSSGASGSYT